MYHVAVISTKISDFSVLLSSVKGVAVHMINPHDVQNYNLNDYDSICILGGVKNEALALLPPARRCIDKQIAKGKRVFCEYTKSIGLTYALPAKSTRFLRVVSCGNIKGIKQGQLLDEQDNTFIAPYICEDGAKPLLVYKKGVQAHGDIEITSTDTKNCEEWALWQENNNLLICAFRICNLQKARFAPRQRWKSVVEHIVQWLLNDSEAQVLLESVYDYIAPQEEKFPAQLEECIKNGINWFENANLLQENGTQGILEGFKTEIDPNGKQVLATDIRADCCAETAFAYYAEYLRTKKPVYLSIANNLEKYVFDNFYIEDGKFEGLLRWSNIGWSVCYQDDAARVLLPFLFKAMYSNKREYIPKIKKSLRFLMNLTGPDGLMVSRMDMQLLNDEEVNKRQTTPANFPSAHYNAFYLAALILFGKLEDDAEMIELGAKGLGTIMQAYPNTKREQSETQEMCRLILPLSILFWASDDANHKAWLYRVCEDLERLRHKSGAHMEWDTGYKASFSRTIGEECSLLANNGDPVVDLLYSVNWLPMAYAQAYFVTKDEWFSELFHKTAIFVVGTQMNSKDVRLHGAWARCFDAEIKEVFGNPNDVGWGPWAMETGWTQAEILSGLIIGSLKDKLQIFYENCDN